MKTEKPATLAQRKFEFSPPRPRPFLAQLPARIDTYEEGVARFFRWRTGLDYYATIDRIVDFVINTRRMKVVDMVADTGAFSLRLAERKGFTGRIYAFDSNITLLERARQRARLSSVHAIVDFRHSEASKIPVPDGFAELIVSIMDFHRHSAPQFLTEALRVLTPDGHLLVVEMLEPKTIKNRLSWFGRSLHLRYVQKNPAEAEAVYYDRDELIRLLFEAGFRQVVIYGLKIPATPHHGVPSLVAATK